ncbi:MAG TPA: hypothetical protein DCO65_09220 [Spartobacteria bacterium]|nr:hypothetical protein [Spartobacteria bacterium]
MEKPVEAAVLSGNETRVAVIGASGYAGEELMRLLIAHPHVDLVAATSRPTRRSRGYSRPANLISNCGSHHRNGISRGQNC